MATFFTVEGMALYKRRTIIFSFLKIIIKVVSNISNSVQVFESIKFLSINTGYQFIFSTSYSSMLDLF